MIDKVEELETLEIDYEALYFKVKQLVTCAYVASSFATKVYFINRAYEVLAMSAPRHQPRKDNDRTNDT